MPKKPTTPAPVTSHTHADSRANIPTEELRDFIADEERNPKTVLFPRDPSLDPQLVWKGKDEQDATDLAVPSVPVYIQEHIKPQNIVEMVRQVGADGRPPEQPMLFGDFNSLDFADRVDFYHHEQHWTNRMILGDSLLVMTSLAEKEALKGKVQMIYVDPPYGIKFGSNWQVSTRKRDVKDGRAEDATRQPEQVKAFRDTWQLGIHSYLAYLRDRLVTARELLTESGSVFVQIGEENVHLVRCLLDEVFGSENFCSQITFFKTTSQTSSLMASSTDALLWYAKKKDQAKYRQPYQIKSIETDKAGVYNWIETPDGLRRRLSPQEKSTFDVITPNGVRIFRLDTMTSQSGGETTGFPVKINGQVATSGKGYWKTNKTGMRRLVAANRVTPSGSTLAYIRFIDDFPAYPYANLWTDTGTGSFTEDKVYVVQTSVKVIERCMLMTTDPGDLVLDPTCGSGTSAYVAEQWGRRWITIDTSRVSIALARTRLMAGRFPYYLLADSSDGKKKEQEINPQIDLMVVTADDDAIAKVITTGDIKRGFVYKRVPHVTLKSIANNDEIDAIHDKYQLRLENLRSQINAAEGKNWQEWEIPREVVPGSESLSPLQEYWRTRRERQKEIDASIAKRADVEMLYDQPYEDNKRVRVSGPFTVESLSPHRVLTTDDPATPLTENTLNDQSFIQMILDNLRAAGVQNTIKNQRLKFTHLEPYAGIWVHAIGEYTEKDGTTKRVAVSVGPELGTVAPEQIKEAAKEAVQGVGFDLLIVCGFAFDPHVSEEAKRYGKLTVLPTRMNPDLAMGGELLKRTGAGNLFMVFGEPDVDIKQIAGKITVTIKGVDVYDPTTGEIRSNKTDDIACWFIDTDYNEECFIVRHAYFTGADEPYEKLKRALRAEIDESAWSALYKTTSYPFEKPKSGKIAVKVINHYGDEVLKVFEIQEGK